MPEQHNQQPTPEELEEANRMWGELKQGKSPGEDFPGGKKPIKFAGHEVRPAADMNRKELERELTDLYFLLGSIDKFRERYGEEVGFGMTVDELVEFAPRRVKEINNQLAKKHPAQGEKS